MELKSGDHICAVYSTIDELAAVVADFLGDGLRRGERCWYVPRNHADAQAVKRALKTRRVNLDGHTKRQALTIVPPEATYAIRGDFDPEETMRVFNDAIEAALTDGFMGFRAAAEMSWVLECTDGANCLIGYEALLRTLFANARATGLCLYDRGAMPIPVLDGALATHPIVRAASGFVANPFYDATVMSLRATEAARVKQKLGRLDHM